MTLKRGAIYAAAIIASLTLLWCVRHGRDKKIDTQIKSYALPESDTAKLIIDPRRHTIVTVTREGTKATYLPDSGASIELSKAGKVTVNARRYGTEVRPFVGGAFGSDIKLRAATGLNLFYFQRFELGGGLLTSGLKDTRIFVHVSYNAYDHWFTSLGIDNRATLHVMAGLKF